MGEREKADKGEPIFPTCPTIWYNLCVTLSRNVETDVNYEQVIKSIFTNYQ